MPWADRSTICARRQVTTDTGAPADDPHQPPSLVIIDLTHPQPFSHRPCLSDQHPPAKDPGADPRPDSPEPQLPSARGRTGLVKDGQQVMSTPARSGCSRRSARAASSRRRGSNSSTASTAAFSLIPRKRTSPASHSSRARPCGWCNATARRAPASTSTTNAFDGGGCMPAARKAISAASRRSSAGVPASPANLSSITATISSAPDRRTPASHALPHPASLRARANVACYGTMSSPHTSRAPPGNGHQLERALAGGHRPLAAAQRVSRCRRSDRCALVVPEQPRAPAGLRTATGNECGRARKPGWARNQEASSTYRTRACLLGQARSQHDTPQVPGAAG
jgi:hypothetical protein